MAEVFLGSVSHRVAMQAERAVLVVKGATKPVRRALVAVEGQDDGIRIARWLTAYAPVHPVEVCVLNVVAPVGPADSYDIATLHEWSTVAKTGAEDVVKTVGAALLSTHYTVSTSVVTGDVAATVAEQAKDWDLVVIASHGRRGIDRLLMGSMSHAILHRVTGSVLVVR